MNRKFFFILFLFFDLFFLFEKSNGQEINLTSQFEESGDIKQKFRFIKVTNLKSEGEGSFRAAVAAKGPRIVFFEVGGVIDLDRKNIRVREPYLVIAGQTAPSPGITLIKGGITIAAHDVVVKHIRVRPGDASQPLKSGFEPDGLTTLGEMAYNIVVDHCSFTWAVDENLSASGPRRGPDSTSRKITFTNNIIAEGLMKSSHHKGSHSMGTLVHDFVKEVVIAGNLYAHNNWRNPFLKAFTSSAIVNNVIYNPGRAAIHFKKSAEELSAWQGPLEDGKATIIGNVMYLGANSIDTLHLVTGNGIVYLEDNSVFDKRGKLQKDWVGSSTLSILRAKPYWRNDIKVLPVDEVAESVVRNVGARPKDRDPIDKRIIQDFLAKSGHIINNQNEVGGYPDYAEVYRSLEIPKENIEVWLNKLAEEVEK